MLAVRVKLWYNFECVLYFLNIRASHKAKLHVSGIKGDATETIQGHPNKPTTVN